MKAKKVDNFLFERNEQNLPGKVAISEFLRNIGFINTQEIEDWWNENRTRFQIHYFNFNTVQPIMGCFLDENTIAINSKVPAPPRIKLYIALHESRHADQYLKGWFEKYYFQPVLENDEEKFTHGYKRLEKDANNFAIKSMYDIGFNNFMRFHENFLRGNESGAAMVFKMMKDDIEKYQPEDFIDLLKNQIL